MEVVGRSVDFNSQEMIHELKSERQSGKELGNKWRRVY